MCRDEQALAQYVLFLLVRTILVAVMRVVFIVVYAAGMAVQHG